MKNIVVNAYPLRFSGALVILNQFIESVYKYAQSDHIYYIFIDSSLDFKSKSANVKFIKVEFSFISKRLFYFNFFGLNKYIKTNNIKPDFILSLANVNTVVSEDVPNYVYFHQSLTVYNYKWNIFSREGFHNWVYSTYYKYLIQKSLRKNTQVIVQLECIKDRFSKIYSIPKDRIVTITPNVLVPIQKEIKELYEVDNSYTNLIYPATPLKYKNHRTIIEALNIISKTTNEKIRLYLTCTREELKSVGIHPTNNVEILFMGNIEYDYLINLYYKMDALLFPSFIESFGLPMIEAATSGIKILASDTDFAREVLKDYDGVEFITTFDVQKWAGKILELNKSHYTALSIESSNSWGKLFKIINRI